MKLSKVCFSFGSFRWIKAYFVIGFMILSYWSFSQSSVVLNEAVLTPLEREYLFILKKNEVLEDQKMELLWTIDSLNKALVSRDSSHANFKPYQSQDLMLLSTHVRMLSVSRTPSSYYLLMSVPISGHLMELDPYSADFYTELYEFYLKPLKSSSGLLTKKDCNSLYIED